MLRPRDIQRRFDNAATGFGEADFVHAVTREGMLKRLEPLLLQPATILDLGSATGSTGLLLRRRFKRAHIVSLDLSRAMLGVAKKNKPWFSKSTFVQANAKQLPFADATFDLIVANQLLPWEPEPQVIFEQVSRVLAKGGVFAFATLGPDSLREIRDAWGKADALFGVPASDGLDGSPARRAPTGRHVNRFPDMHDIGDGLVRAGLADPVLDVDRLGVSYASADRLFADLTRSGGRNALAGRARGLVGRSRFKAMTEALSTRRADRKIVLDLELVYGHCWGSGPRIDPANYRIDANRIPLRR